MAERTVAVRLLANVDQYQAAMRKASQSTTTLVKDGQINFARLGTQMQSVGRSASMYVTLPLAAVGVAAVGASMKFESAFSQMQGLAGVTADEVDMLKESVLDLAGETARSPQELAEALYFAKSSGLDTAQAMDVLEIAARASAAGMGSTTDVVGLLSTAIASYGAENIDAARAADILTAAVREGRAEPEEMAAALGTVLPVASQLGIGFEEVAGATAYMSNVFGNTDETVVRLNGVFRAMLDPSKQGRKALEEMGGSAEGLRQAISQDGLVGALDYLREHGFAANEQALGSLFEDARAMQGALVLLNDESGRLVPTLDAVADSSGSLGEAFSVAADTDGFKMKQALVEIQTALIKLGDVILPVAATIGAAVADIASWFADLPSSIQTVIVVLGGLAAAGGPVLVMAGSLLRNWQTLSKTFAGSAGAMGTTARSLGLLGVAAGAAYIAFNFLTRSEELATTHIDTASGALQTQTVAAYNAAVAAGQATTEVDALAIAHIALSNAISEAADDELNLALATLNVTSEETLDVLTRLGSGSLPTIRAEMERLTMSYFGVESVNARMALSLRGQGESYESIALAVGSTIEVVEAWDNALSTTTGFADHNKEEINALALEYLNLQARIPGAASETLLAAEAIAGNRNEAMNAIPVYQEYVRQVLALPPAQRDAIITTEGFVGTISELVPGLEAGTEAGENFAGAMRAASDIDTSSNLMDYWSDVEHILSETQSAFRTALGTGAQWIKAHDDYAQRLLDFRDSLDHANDGVVVSNELSAEQYEHVLENRDGIFELADGLIALTESNLAAGKGQAETNREYLAGREALLDAAEAAGFNRDEVEDLISQYGLVPELVTTTIDLANDALAKWRIDRYLEKLDEIPEEQAVALEAAIDEEDWALANELLRELTEPRTATINIQPKVLAPIGSRLGISNLGSGWGGSGKAHGGYIDRPEISPLGEGGRPEVVFPLTNPGRIVELWNDPRVSGPMLAALGNLMPAPQYPMQAPVAQPAPSMSYTFGDINVGDRKDADTMVDKLQELEFVTRHTA